MTNLSSYIINLDRMPERWARVESLFVKSALPFQRVAGVDGLTTDFSTTRICHRTAHRLFGGSLGKGTIACSLSHVQALKAFLASGHNIGLICEDDVFFDPDHFCEALSWVLSLGDLWDICAFQLNHRGGPWTICQSDKWRLCAYFFSVTGGGAYLVHRHTAQKLVACAFPLEMPFDHFYTQGHKLKLRFTGLETLKHERIVQQSLGPSAIEAAGRERHGQASRIVRFLTACERVRRDVLKAFYTLMWIGRRKRH